MTRNQRIAKTAAAREKRRGSEPKRERYIAWRPTPRRIDFDPQPRRWEQPIPDNDPTHAKADPVGAAYGEWAAVLPMIFLLAILVVFVGAPICAHFGIDIWGPVFKK